VCESIRKSKKIEEGLIIFDDGFVKISEDFFWKMVDIINWKWLSLNNSYVDKNMHKHKLLKKYPLAVWKKVKEIHDEKWKGLREFLRSSDSDWVVGTSDDSTWDLCSHVVGLGREEYLNNFYQSWRLINRGRSHDFVENFGYWIPTDENVTLPNSVDFIEKEK